MGGGKGKGQRRFRKALGFQISHGPRLEIDRRGEEGGIYVGRAKGVFLSSGTA